MISFKVEPQNEYSYNYQGRTYSFKGTESELDQHLRKLEILKEENLRQQRKQEQYHGRSMSR